MYTEIKRIAAKQFRSRHVTKYVVYIWAKSLVCVVYMHTCLHVFICSLTYACVQFGCQCQKPICLLLYTLFFETESAIEPGPHYFSYPANLTGPTVSTAQCQDYINFVMDLLYIGAGDIIACAHVVPQTVY